MIGKMDKEPRRRKENQDHSRKRSRLMLMAAMILGSMTGYFINKIKNTDNKAHTFLTEQVQNVPQTELPQKEMSPDELAALRNNFETLSYVLQALDLNKESPLLSTDLSNINIETAVQKASLYVNDYIDGNVRIFEVASDTVASEYNELKNKLKIEPNQHYIAVEVDDDKFGFSFICHLEQENDKQIVLKTYGPPTIDNIGYKVNGNNPEEIQKSVAEIVAELIDSQLKISLHEAIKAKYSNRS